MSLAHHQRPGRTHRRSQSGAGIVEFAFVALVLVVMAGGAFDYGLGWRLGLVTNEAARSGARTGSSLGKTVLADWYSLSSARASLASGDRLNSVQRVVIYESQTADGAVPPSCVTGSSTSNRCNILSGDQFRVLAQGDFNTTTGCIKAGKATVANWCPTSRSTFQTTAPYYGVWIQTTYDRAFKVPSSTITVNRDAVMRIEPED